ncbi:MAG: ABC transporter substrate-binding protein [Microbacterium sp.]|uniref:ABC transporter substrate-binding protein n=1 Tax=Microbacterium sp. TaxID=51671 RepID=UPI002721FF13|nr:ABC transporter substrate-binding protein [Microbacterium sp.]MDO8382978.1 ABC transporter substrate-binding protein [Microbacterium sp.]
MHITRHSRRNRSHRIVALGAALGASALALSACASVDDTEAGTDVLTPLTLQAAWVNDAEFMGYFIAIDDGLYEDAGIDLEYLSGGPNVIPESTLLSGDADIALTSPDTTISAITGQGADLVIIGAQYQQNPLGIVSLAESGITGPEDLVGKTVAVPDVNRLAFGAMLEINDIPASEVTVVPYAYDPTPLISGEVDATLDFVTNVPFTIEEQGYETASFTLYDAGYRIPNDTVVVTRDTLETQHDALQAWLHASIEGWEINFADPDVYPPQFEDTWFQGTGRTIENELFFNNAQVELIEAPTGMFLLTDEAIQDTIDTLALIGIDATADMFDMSLFD